MVQLLWVGARAGGSLGTYRSNLLLDSPIQINGNWYTLMCLGGRTRATTGCQDTILISRRLLATHRGTVRMLIDSALNSKDLLVARRCYLMILLDLLPVHLLSP